jgi:hypothetical protein
MRLIAIYRYYRSTGAPRVAALRRAFRLLVS